jgi:hypothetical protein
MCPEQVWLFFNSGLLGTLFPWTARFYCMDLGLKIQTGKK